MLAADLVALLTTALVVRTGALLVGDDVTGGTWMVIYFAVVLAVLGFRGGYARRVRVEILDEAGRAAQATLLAALATISARTLITGDADGATDTAILALCTGALLVASRAMIAQAFVRALRVGQLRRPTLILGAGKVGNLTAERLIENPAWGLDPVGFLDDDPLETPDDRPVLPVLGGPPDFDRVLAEHQIEHFIVGFSMASHQLMLGLIRRCWERGVSVSLVPRLFELERDRAGTERLGSLPLLSLNAPASGGFLLGVKYGLDRVAAAGLLVLTAPIQLLVALLVKFVDGGPVIYSQHRVGRDGRHFVMLKFKTMDGAPEVDGESDSRWADAAAAHGGIGSGALTDASDRDRTTRLGYVLRKLSLDELPQLWNVLMGEMSMIGPRPERIQYAQRFEDAIYRYGDRHRVRSGLTGWAQVNGFRGQTSLKERVELDNYYIENWSLSLDFRIVLKTIAVLAGDVVRLGRGRRRSDPPEDAVSPDTPARGAVGNTS